jgi:hypothetical protein
LYLIAFGDLRNLVYKTEKIIVPGARRQNSRANGIKADGKIEAGEYWDKLDNNEFLKQDGNHDTYSRGMRAGCRSESPFSTASTDTKGNEGKLPRLPNG